MSSACQTTLRPMVFRLFPPRTSFPKNGQFRGNKKSISPKVLDWFESSLHQEMSKIEFFVSLMSLYYKKVKTIKDKNQKPTN